MIKEFKKTFRYAIIIITICAIGFLFYDYTVSTGMVLGLATYYIYLRFMSYNVTGLLEQESAGKGTLILMHLADIAILILPLLIASLLPQYFNIFGVFAGLIINRLLLFVIYGQKRKMEEEE